MGMGQNKHSPNDGDWCDLASDSATEVVTSEIWRGNALTALWGVFWPQ